MSQMNKPRILAIMFLSLSLLSSVLELGPVMILIVEQRSIFEILGVGLAYQLGNLGANTIKMRKSIIITILVISFMLSIFFSPNNYVMLSMSVALTSLCLQKLRREILANNPDYPITIAIKRTARIIGFSLVGFISYPFYIVIIGSILVLALFASILIQQDWKKSAEIHHPRVNILAIIMLIHQCHYFSYCYLIPVLFVRQANLPIEAAGLLFVVGWISYISSERLFQNMSLINLFIGGHLVVAACLTVIGIFYISPLIALAGWFITGLGGGTVFCLTRLNKTEICPRIELDIWEDIGHVLGVGISILALKILILEQPFQLFFVSAGIALIAGLTMFFIRTRISVQPKLRSES